MASEKLSQTLDKLDAFLQQQRGSIGSSKAVAALNDLIAIQRFIQEHGKEIKDLPRVMVLLGKVKELLDISVEQK